MTKYRFWKNYETWNVALWIGNDEGLYNMALEVAKRGGGYKEFVEDLKEVSGETPIAFQTPDGVSWTDSGLSMPELNRMMKKFRTG
jgi:hypothetical protein